MRRLALPLLALLSCASEEHARSTTYDYGGLRKPAELETPIEQAQPVVPPPKPEEAPPKADPCAKLCATYNGNDAECDRLSEACDKMFREQGHTNGETCQRQKRICARVVEMKANLGGCNCE